MAFDPTKPVNGVLIDADFLRGQFNALNDKIDAVPAGPPGPPGPGTIVSLTGGVVDNTDPANPVVRTDVVGGVPKPIVGDRIAAGATNHFLGADVSASVAFLGDPVSVVDGDAGTSVVNLQTFIAHLGTARGIRGFRITVTFTNVPRDLSFAFSDDGTNWTEVGTGILPNSGGTPTTSDFVFADVGEHPFWAFFTGGGSSTEIAEVGGYVELGPAISEEEIPQTIARVAAVNAGDAATQAAAAADATAKADAVLAASSNNTNAVALLGLTVSDPPTQAEMQSIADKMDELITAQRR